MSSEKHDEYHWLSTDCADYGDPEFGETLAGKLEELTSSSLGPGATLHYRNVAIAYQHLYGFDVEGVGANANTVTRSGDQGNIAELRIPTSAGLLDKAWNIVVGPELTWSAEATTTDYASEAEAITARNALQYYFKHESVGSRAKQVMRECMGMAEGAMHIPWDVSKGEALGVEMVGEGEEATKRLVHSGDIAFRRIPTWDIIRDPTARSFDDLTWIVVREWPDKFDVAAPFKGVDDEKFQACLKAPTDVAGQSWIPLPATYDVSSSRIPVYYLYALRSPAVPGGRQTVFLQDGTVLSDEPLAEAYAELAKPCIGPVVPVRAGEYSGTVWPYTKFAGVLGAGQARDALFKDLLTNATAVSGNIISVEANQMDMGMGTAVQTGGPQVVPRPAGSPVPQVLQLQQSHPEHFKLAGTLGSEQQQIMGIDNITAGLEVGANLSGAAMALMTSTSVQNNSQLQSIWTAFVQAIGNVVLKHIQYNMKTPKRIALAGNARSSLVTTTELSGDKVKGIQRVLASIGAALQQTDAGKYEIASTALKEKWAQTPEQFQAVLDTGRLDALTQDLSNELLLINSENEKLGRGEEAVVMLDDNHVLHLKSHRAVVAGINARENPAVVQALQAHQDAHLRVLRETDPAILQLFGQPSMAPAPQPGATDATQPPRPPQEQQQAAGPSMPKLPNGESAAPVAGTKPPALAVKQ